ncbi:MULTISPECIES: hypothetical protein [Herbaspirillum]|uniref:Uncharacterized protein n=2 Tax=Herbaspirillum huttiense TaxID=863372 RepID=A0AAJ2HDV7_9BURK|nr:MULTISPECIES: hypothetical protein [Herbaspirillum]MDR9836955.1 hypothetical protein [Herbaspirillum huttiense]
MQTNNHLTDEVNLHCVGTTPYRGYKSTYCGDGLVVFVGPSGDEVKGHSQERTTWLAPAWTMAKVEIDRRLGTDGK